MPLEISLKGSGKSQFAWTGLARITGRATFILCGGVLARKGPPPGDWLCRRL